MSPMVMILVGFVAGLMAMTIVSLYKWIFNYWKF
jgi:hypothetical protein